jgi:DNA-directed RNA polymerase subunit RPC12/RpoP
LKEMEMVLGICIDCGKRIRRASDLVVETTLNSHYGEIRCEECFFKQ